MRPVFFLSLLLASPELVPYFSTPASLNLLFVSAQSCTRLCEWQTKYRSCGMSPHFGLLLTRKYFTYLKETGSSPPSPTTSSGAFTTAGNVALHAESKLQLLNDIEECQNQVFLNNYFIPDKSRCELNWKCRFHLGSCEPTYLSASMYSTEFGNRCGLLGEVLRSRVEGQSSSGPSGLSTVGEDMKTCATGFRGGCQCTGRGVPVHLQGDASEPTGKGMPVNRARIHQVQNDGSSACIWTRKFYHGIHHASGRYTIA